MNLPKRFLALPRLLLDIQRWGRYFEEDWEAGHKVDTTGGRRVER